MLTVDFERLRVGPGVRLLDLGCGEGRHTREARRRGAFVVALDRSAISGADGAAGVRGDGLRLPFRDAMFDRVVAAEVLEHVDDDRAAMAELARVVRPGGLVAVTVPRWLPERVCWALADDYHAPAVPGGHVRIYRRRQLVGRLRAAGLRPVASHHAHALHSPYWWLKCAVGVGNETARSVRLYHRFLVRDILRPIPAVRLAERALNPVLGKSLVVYLAKQP
ncbi:MAG TPA: class I SAM-dependent methyltransferase [Acidimicrobiales bacterium]|nr:class I SAM-dependent methyltransferase [Acidimicrobiales bacterium]